MPGLRSINAGALREGAGDGRQAAGAGGGPRLRQPQGSQAPGPAVHRPRDTASSGATAFDAKAQQTLHTQLEIETVMIFLKTHKFTSR